MMMMGLHFMGKVPFRTVYLTSIVTDENGDKMSKTKGNVIDPLDVVHGATLEPAARARRRREAARSRAAQDGIKKHFGKGIPAMGADALRFALAALNTRQPRIRLSIERVEGYRNFINKLWNASRFALMNLDGYDPERFEAQLRRRPAHAPRSRCPSAGSCRACRRRAPTVDTALEAFRFSDAANAIYHFVWDELCDWYIELAKPHLHQSAEARSRIRRARRAATSVQGVLATVLETTMRLLHPFAPFVTEEIWQKLPKPPQLPGSLMITVFPRGDPAWIDAAAEARDAARCRTSRSPAACCARPTACRRRRRSTVELRVASDGARATLEKYHDADRAQREDHGDDRSAGGGRAAARRGQGAGRRRRRDA